jgi:hypothetical protein
MGLLSNWGAGVIGTANLFVDRLQKSREANASATKAREDSEKTLRIVTDIQRALNPLKDVLVSFSLSYPLDQPAEIAKYRERLERALNAKYSGKTIIDPHLTELNLWGPGTGVGTVALYGDERPSWKDEKLAVTVTSSGSLTLLFFKTPIDPITLTTSSAPRPDIQISVS